MSKYNTTGPVDGSGTFWDSTFGDPNRFGTLSKRLLITVGPTSLSLGVPTSIRPVLLGPTRPRSTGVKCASLYRQSGRGPTPKRRVRFTVGLGRRGRRRDGPMERPVRKSWTLKLDGGGTWKDRPKSHYVSGVDYNDNRTNSRSGVGWFVGPW